MAFESITNTFFPRRVTLQYNSGTAERVLLQLDCTPSERPEMASQVTEFPIEDGAVVSDHIILKPSRLTLEGIVSNHPINLSTAMVGNVAGVIGGALSGPAKTVATAAGVLVGNKLVSQSAQPAKAALDVFKEIREKKLLLTIITGLDTYTNMVMERFSPVRTANTAGSLVFSAAFKEAKIVTSQTVAVPAEALSEDTRDMGADVKDSGRMLPKALDDAKSKVAESWAYKLTRKVFPSLLD